MPGSFQHQQHANIEAVRSPIEAEAVQAYVPVVEVHVEGRAEPLVQADRGDLHFAAVYHALLEVHSVNVITSMNGRSTSAIPA